MQLQKSGTQDLGCSANQLRVCARRSSRALKVAGSVADFSKLKLVGATYLSEASGYGKPDSSHFRAKIK